MNDQQALPQLLSALRALFLNYTGRAIAAGDAETAAGVERTLAAIAAGDASLVFHLAESAGQATFHFSVALPSGDVERLFGGKLEAPVYQ